VKVAYFVDASGTASSCTPLPESASQPTQLIEAACSQLMSGVARAPVTSKAGAVPVVKTAAILFTVE
jgi:hypothetical protein